MFWRGHLKNILFLKSNFIKYDNQILIWKVILLLCTLSWLHFLCQDCPLTAMTSAAMTFGLGFPMSGGGFLFGFFLHAKVRSEEDKSVIAVVVALVEEVAKLPPFWWSCGVSFPAPSRWRLRYLGFPHTVRPRRHSLELVDLWWQGHSRSITDKKIGYSGDDDNGLSCGDNNLDTSRFFSNMK